MLFRQGHLSRLILFDQRIRASFVGSDYFVQLKLATRDGQPFGPKRVYDPFLHSPKSPMKLEISLEFGAVRVNGAKTPILCQNWVFLQSQPPVGTTLRVNHPSDEQPFLRILFQNSNEKRLRQKSMSKQLFSFGKPATSGLSCLQSHFCSKNSTTTRIDLKNRGLAALRAAPQTSLRWHFVPKCTSNKLEGRFVPKRSCSVETLGFILHPKVSPSGNLQANCLLKNICLVPRQIFFRWSPHFHSVRTSLSEPSFLRFVQPRCSHSIKVGPSVFIHPSRLSFLKSWCVHSARRASRCSICQPMFHRPDFVGFGAASIGSKLRRRWNWKDLALPKTHFGPKNTPLTLRAQFTV